jgi:hypothetical protein
MHMSIWAEIRRVGSYVNTNRVTRLLGEYPKLTAAGEALDFMAQALAQAPNETPEEAHRLFMAGWTAERLRAAILMLLVNCAPNAAILAERALTGVELQLLFKMKPHIEKTYMAGERDNRDELRELRRNYPDLRDVGWLRGAIWPHAPRRGARTISDDALAADGDNPATDFDAIRAIAMLSCEQLILIHRTFARVFESPSMKARYDQIQESLSRFMPAETMLPELMIDQATPPYRTTG